MTRYMTFLVFALAFGSAEADAQQAVSFKNFSSFKNLVPGVDFYASRRQLVTPYEKPISETVARLQTLLGKDLPKGAIFICSTLEQKDSIYEPKVLKSGYGWTLAASTPEVSMQERMERMKSQMGGEIPEEFKSRIEEFQSQMNNLPPEMMAEAEKQSVDTVNQQISHAVLWALLAPRSQFRSSRLGDMGKSPLPDWLDIGIAAYASGKSPDESFLLENIDQTFSLEDIFLMSRPFVASSVSGSGGSFRGGGGGMPGGMFGDRGGGGGMPGGMPRMGGGGSMGGFPSGGFPSGGFGSRGSGGFGRGSGQRGDGQRVLPKDEQDRMLFDTESESFFLYLIEKVGTEKVSSLVKKAEKGEEVWKLLSEPDMLGTDLEKMDGDWVSWIRAQNPQKS